MASESLYNYTIGFDTSGVKELEEEIKRNEKELDRYEQKIKDLEGVMDTLAKAGGVGSDSYRETAKELEIARKEADKYKNSIEKLKNTSQHSFSEMQKSFMSLIRTVGLFAVVRGTIQRSLDFYEQAEQLDFLAQKTGIAAERLQELSAVSARYGGTTEGTVNSIENIRTNKEEYQKAGIRIEQDPSKTLENVARKMEKLKTDAEKWQLAETLGIDEATTRALIEGVDKYNESLQKSAKYKLYTKEDILRMREYRQIQQDIRDGTNNIFGAIYRLLLPAITAVSKVIRQISNWLAEHEGAVKIVATLAAIAAAVGAVIIAIKTVGVILGVLNPEIVAIIAVITFLIAAINDLIVFIQGGDSIIGEILEKLGYDTEAIRKDVINTINQIRQWIIWLIEWLKRLGDEGQRIAQQLKSIWDAVPEPLKKIIGGGFKAMAFFNPITMPAAAAITAGQHTLAKYKKNDFNAVPAGAQSNYYNSQSQNATNTQNSKNIANTNNRSVNVSQITINTQASDARAVAKGVKDTLDSLDNGQVG